MTTCWRGACQFTCLCFQLRLEMDIASIRWSWTYGYQSYLPYSDGKRQEVQTKVPKQPLPRVHEPASNIEDTKRNLVESIASLRRHRDAVPPYPSRPDSETPWVVLSAKPLLTTFGRSARSNNLPPHQICVTYTLGAVGSLYDRSGSLPTWLVLRSRFGLRNRRITSPRPVLVSLVMMTQAVNRACRARIKHIVRL